MLKPNVSYCEDNNEVHYNPWTWADTYLTFVAREAGTFTFTPSGSNVISYSTDNGENWREGNEVTVNNGDKVLWKGMMTPLDLEGVGTFSSTANFDVQGNVMSLLFDDDFKGEVDLTEKDSAFCMLFNENAKIVSAENLSLSATTLAYGCYLSMFYGCTSLSTAPVLPATTLASWCYNSMFSGCTSLTTAPELPATTLASSCYNSMFYDCTSLTAAPVLPATTLANSCYSSMFYGCTSLTTAPELPATTLVRECYQSMFRGCTALTAAPELPATTLADYCYSNMFINCRLLATAPVLPATTLVSKCYEAMFAGCTKLNYIKAMFTTEPSTEYTNYWVDGVSGSGTFVKNSAATWNVTGASGIPSGWTVETASA